MRLAKLAPFSLLAALAGPVGAADKTLNNFVTEHVNVSLDAVPTRGPNGPAYRFVFRSSRQGWVFLSLRGGRPGVRVCLDSSRPGEAVLLAGDDRQRPLESMRFIQPGQHRVNVFAAGTKPAGTLIVRSVPEIMLFPVSFAAWKKETSANYGLKKDWDFFRKHMAADSNTIAFFNAEDFEPYIRQWRAEGKKALIKQNIPALDSTPEQIYERWGRPLEKYPFVDGVTIDEFGAGQRHQKRYRTWAGVFDRIARNPRCRGKKVYAFWGSAAPSEKMRTLVAAVQRNNFRWLHEGYYMLRKSEGGRAGQLRYITAWGGNKFEQYEKMFPGLVQNNLLYTFGIYDYHWTCDLTPELDFKVFLDMQFHHVATHPAFKGIYGVCLYTLNSTTEEMCRYAGALVRHYCIEGRTDHFNGDPLELNHLKNPGFEEGTAHWQVRAAGPNSVRPMPVADLPYKNTVTDRAIPNEKMVLRTVRSDSRPNLISQQIANLTKGRWYSVRVMTSDLTKPEETRLIPTSITIDGAELREELSMDRPWTTRFARSSGAGKMTVCWNFRLRVFRAKSDRAVLTLSDWAGPDSAGGEVGHEVIWDFIKVQPYYADPGVD